MNNSISGKLVFLFIFLPFLLCNTAFADNFFENDSLGCEVESVVFECQGVSTNRAAAEAWYQANFDRLKANCIGRDSGKVIISSFGLGDQSLCGGCIVYGNFQIIDTLGEVTTDYKSATFEIIDTSPPVFLDSTHDTIECSYPHPIFGWQEGVQNHSRVSDCSLWSIGFTFSQLIEKTEKTETYEYRISMTDSYRNTGYQTIYLTVLDTTPPSITCNPDDLQLECNGQVNNQTAVIEWNETNLTKLKNCSREYCSDVFVTSNFEVDDINNNCELLVTYSITDEYNNISNRTATLSIIDTTPPMGQCNLGKSIIACTQQYPIKPQLIESHNNQLEFLAQCASDNCGGVEITHDFDTTLFREDCLSGPTDFFITYYLTDNCGNISTKIKAYDITYRDMENELCENLRVESQNNQLIIAGLSAPITIAKIYDENYELIFECNSSTKCPETINISDLEAGSTYYIDVQFFEEDWNFICEDKRDIIIQGDGEPCDTSICQGDVILRTQAEVDAFCGCEVIEGNLVLLGEGVNGGVLGQSSDIFDIDIFISLKRVDGDLIIWNTEITKLYAFTNLSEIKSNLVIKYGQKLDDLQGFNSLNKIGSLVLEYNPIIKNLQGLENVFIERQINIIGNNGLVSIKQLANLEELNYLLVIEDNETLQNLNGLENLQSLENLIIRRNEKLSDCCFISHLIDNDSNNGAITGNIDISDNLQFCNSIEEILANCETQSPTCENIQILTQNNQITIEGLSAPNEIIKVFDKNYNTLFECNANCEDNQFAGTFPNGNYIVDLQLYDENWQQICSEQRPVVLADSTFTIDCSIIQIAASGNEITLSKVASPNTIVKVFDPNWQLIYDCTATCENEIIVPVESEGVYHTDIQFYDENWKFVCADKQDLEIITGDQPCDTSICTGDVILQTQAEVDAFCGCEVIEGYLIIGSFDFTSDVHDLSNLVNLKEIKGRLVIGQTSITSLKGLDNLTQMGSFYFYRNHSVKSFQDLKKLKELNGQLFIDANNSLENLIGLHSIDSLLSIFIWGTEKLNNLDDLKSLRFLSGLFVSGNSINNLGFVNQLENTKIGISIAGNSEIMNLDGLEKFDNLSNLLLGGNDNLVDISVLKNVKYITGNLTIERNPNLENCCSIRHLVDSDTTNGRVLGNIQFGSNGGTNSQCEHVYRLLEQCPNIPISPCQTTQIQSTNNQLSIINLFAPIEILKVFDANYNIVYQCFADCEENITIPDLAAGTYHININFYDENWQPICEKNETVQIEDTTQSRNSELLPTDFTLHPNPAQEATYIDLQKLNGEAAELRLINQFGQIIWQKALPKIENTKEKITFQSIPNGLYFVQIQAKGRRTISKKLLVNRLY